MKAVANANCYNIDDHSVTELKSLELATYGLKAVSLDGSLYVVGGASNDFLYHKAMRKYSFSSKEWENCSDMLTSRKNFGIGMIDEQIYAVGGRTVNNIALNSAEW